MGRSPVLALDFTNDCVPSSQHHWHPPSKCWLIGNLCSHSILGRLNWICVLHLAQRHPRRGPIGPFDLKLPTTRRDLLPFLSRPSFKVTIGLFNRVAVFLMINDRFHDQSASSLGIHLRIQVLRDLIGGVLMLLSLNIDNVPPCIKNRVSMSPSNKFPVNIAGSLDNCTSPWTPFRSSFQYQFSTNVLVVRRLLIGLRVDISGPQLWLDGLRIVNTLVYLIQVFFKQNTDVRRVLHQILRVIQLLIDAVIQLIECSTHFILLELIIRHMLHSCT